MEFHVDAPGVCDTVTIVSVGSIVHISDGVQLAFGPGQLGGDTSVSIASVAQDDLALPPPNAEYFDFVAAFDLSIEGDDVEGPLQIAAPVSADVGAPGDKVYFFQKQTIETGEGEFLETWVMFDSGAIDANGVARTNSPPFPGLSKSGQVMIARASPPQPQGRIDVTGPLPFTPMTHTPVYLAPAAVRAPTSRKSVGGGT